MSFVGNTLLGTKAKSSSPTSYDALPDNGQAALSALWSQGQNLASNIAPFSTAETGALNNLSTSFTPNFNFGQKADATFGQVGNQVNLANNFLNRGSDQIDLSNMFMNKGTSAITGEEYGNSLNMFMNPFTGQVVDSAIRDIRDESARQGSDIASLASTNGAFGSTRQSLLESELGKNTQRTIGDVSGQLRSQGFESSAQKALQSLTDQRGRYLQAAGNATNNAGVYGNFAGTANQGAGILNELGSNYLAGRELMGNLGRQSSLDTLTAGQIQRDQPLQGLQLLQQLYGSTLVPLAGGGSSSVGASKGLLDYLAQASGSIANAVSNKPTGG